jgi:hypothetical protein
MSGTIQPMATAGRVRDLWSMTIDSQWIDVADFTRAVSDECLQTGHDFRTRLLIRDSLLALACHFEPADPLQLLAPAAKEKAKAIFYEELGEVRFPSLSRRLMDHARSDKVLEFLAELGRACRTPARIDIGGSASLILSDLLDRYTEDVDAVDEVPSVLRNDHELIDRLVQRFDLRLAHFQSHYLPDGWKRRVHSIGVFGQLTVFVVDPVDIFVGKVFSKREKDLDDCRTLKRQLDWPTIVARLQSSAGPLRAIPSALSAAEHNWGVLTNDPLPGESA